MAIGAINPISANQVAALYAPRPSGKSPAPAASPAQAPASSPAATVSLSGAPSSVDSDDRALYAQVLRASGNAAAALGAVSAQDRKDKDD